MSFSDYQATWEGRVGAVGAATVNALNPNPAFGAAVDMASTPMTTRQYSGAVNAIQMVNQENLERQMVQQQQMASARQPEEQDLAAVKDAEGWLAKGIGWVGDRVSDAGSFLDDHGLGFVSDAGRGISAGVNWLGQNVIDPFNRGLSAAVQAGTVAEEGSGNFWANLFEGETWEEAWDRAEHTSFGRAFTDPWAQMDHDVRRQWYEDGFDEYGNPLNKEFLELRQEGEIYNLVSGSLDFLKTWFLDPTVLFGKGAGIARAASKADLDRMPTRMRAQFLEVATTPSARLADMKKPSLAHPILSRAYQVRQNLEDLKLKFRANELTVADAAQYQAFAYGANGAVAAHALAEAAKATKFESTKLDPGLGRFTDEYDDDIFDLTVAALFGNQDAKAALLTRSVEVGDALDALTTVKIAKLDQDLADLEHIKETGFDKIFDSLDEAPLAQRIDEAENIKAQLSSESVDQQRYLDWLQHVSGTAPAGTTPYLSMVPQEKYSLAQQADRITAAAYRRSGHSRIAQTFTRVPRAMWLRRPGVVDLHGHNSAFESTQRYFDQMEYWGRNRGMDELAQEKGFESFRALKSDMLNRVAAAPNDTSLRVLMGHVEDVGIAAVARSHGLTPDEAITVANDVRGRRADLINQVKGQAEKRSYSTAVQGGKEVDDFSVTHADGSVQTIKLPIDVTQLDNNMVLTDLRVLSGALRRDGETVKAEIARKGGSARDLTSSALTSMNAVWKPAVLFRLGYPIRTVGDEAARILAATGSLMDFISQVPQAGVRGAINVPLRGYNYAAKKMDRVSQLRWHGRQDGVNLDILPEGAGDIAWADKKLLEKVQRSLGTTEAWQAKDLNVRANGGAGVRPPAAVTKLDGALAQGDDLVINPFTLNPLKTRSILQPFPNTADVVDDAVGLGRYMSQHARLLAHKDAVVQVKKADDGYAVSVARKGSRQTKKLGLLQGVGHRDITARTATGAQVELDAAFGQGGELYRGFASSSPHFASQWKTYEHNLGQMRAAHGTSKSLLPEDKGFAEAWAGELEKWSSSQMVRRILDDTDEGVHSWLTGSMEGRAVARRIPWRAHNPERWIDELRAHTDNLLPTEALRAKFAAGEQITPDDLKNHLATAPAENVPSSIDGPSIDIALGDQGIGGAIGSMVERGYHLLATLPTDTLVRQPFFTMHYNRKARELAETVEGDVIEPEHMARIAAQSREHALRQVRRYMFSSADNTEFIHTLRFLAPFAGAWQEALGKWMGIFMERPESYMRMVVNGWKDMDELYFIQPVTEDGIPTEDGDASHVLITMPDSVRTAIGAILPGIGADDLENVKELKVSKESLNVSLQGDPFWLPGGGPLMQIPAKFLLENDPELADQNAFSAAMWKYLFPTGVPAGIREAVSPSWMNQAWRAFKQEDDPVFGNLPFMIYRDDVYRWRQNGEQGPKPTLEEAAGKAKATQWFNVFAKLTLPFSGQVRPETQFFVDQWRALLADPDLPYEQAVKQFVDEHGEDAYLFMETLSQNNSNVAPTSAGWANFKKFEKEVQAFPELGALITGLSTQRGEYNDAAYGIEKRTNVAPGDPRHMRDSRSPADAIAEAEAQQGWGEYDQFQKAMQAEANAQGVESWKEIDEFKVLNQQWISETKDRLPGWGVDWDQRDEGKSYRFVDAMREAIASGADFVNRPDWQGIIRYIQIHDSFAGELDARFLAGGSRNIEAQDNEDLFLAFDQAVGSVVHSNLMFEEVYNRYLSNHSLTNGSG